MLYIISLYQLKKGRPPQMVEVSSAVTKAFGQTQAMQHSDAKPDVELFIIEGLLTHFFCYYTKPDKNNVWWLLGHMNKQKHWLKTSHFSRSLSCDTDQVQTQLRFCSNTHCVSLGLLKYYLLKILGSCNTVKGESSKQWVPPYESEVGMPIMLSLEYVKVTFVLLCITGPCYCGKIFETADFK